MRQAIEDYLAYLEKIKFLKRSSLEAYRTDLDFFFKWVKEDLPNYQSWRELTKQDLEDFKEHLEKFGFSLATVVRKLTVVRTFIKYLSDKGLVKPFLSDMFPQSKHPKRDPKSITEVDIAKLLEAVVADKRFFAKRNLAVFYLIWRNGLSVSEAVSVNLVDLDLDNQILQVSSERNRVLSLDNETLTALRSYLENERPKVKQNSSGSLFLNRAGKQITRQGFWLVLKLYARDAGLREIEVSSRSLRNAFITERLKEGVSLEKIRETLGFRYIHNVMFYAR